MHQQLNKSISQLFTAVVGVNILIIGLVNKRNKESFFKLFDCLDFFSINFSWFNIIRRTFIAQVNRGKDIEKTSSKDVRAM